jgi:hypothetical protein
LAAKSVAGFTIIAASIQFRQGSFNCRASSSY